ncbi:hypothetical protein BDE02_19G060800 [Populus trichocarpa]|nr:hypothetical protein BDE02_19G060800 [Populus trichocarpa]
MLTSDLGFRFLWSTAVKLLFETQTHTHTQSLIIRSCIYLLSTFSAEQNLFPVIFPWIPWETTHVELVANQSIYYSISLKRKTPLLLTILGRQRHSL